MASATFHDFFIKNGPSGPQLKFFGAGLAALGSGFIYRGGKEIALGRYLWSGRTDLINLTLFYDQNVIDKAQQSPRWTWFKGHMWDLAHKVLAATTFYLTSNHSSLGSIATLLPRRLKTTTVAQILFQAAESSRINSNFLFTFHIIDLTPIIVKMIHVFLDAASLRFKGQDARIEYWKEKTQQLGKWSESLWYARLALVACGVAGGASNILSFLAFMIFTSLLKYRIVLFDTSWKKIYDLAFAGAAGILASFNSMLVSPPSQLNQLFTDDFPVFSINWLTPNDLEACLSFLKDHSNKGTLSHEEMGHAYFILQNDLQNRLENDIYLDLGFKFLSREESDLKKIFGAGGVFGKICKNPYQLRLEQARFSIICLCVNLIRLKNAFDKQELTSDQCKVVQNCLYLQTLENIYGEIKEEDLLICNIGDHIKLNYIKWKEREVLQRTTHECIAHDPFFTPLFQILPQVPDGGDEGWAQPLRLFLISLAVSIHVSNDKIPAIKKGSPNDHSSSISRDILLRYRAIPNARYRAFSEILEQIVRS